MQSGGLAVVSRLRVAPLSGDIGARRIDRRKFVASDSPRQHFLFSCGRIEPPPVAGLHERHRKWPVFIADHQRLAIGSSVLEMPLLAHGDGEHLLVLTRDRRFRGVNQLFPLRPEDRQQRLEVPGLDRRQSSAFTASSGVGNVRSALVCASTTPVNRHALRSATAAMRRRR